MKLSEIGKLLPNCKLPRVSGKCTECSKNSVPVLTSHNFCFMQVNVGLFSGSEIFLLEIFVSLV